MQNNDINTFEGVDEEEVVVESDHPVVQSFVKGDQTLEDFLQMLRDLLEEVDRLQKAPDPDGILDYKNDVLPLVNALNSGMSLLPSLNKLLGKDGLTEAQINLVTQQVETSKKELDSWVQNVLESKERVKKSIADAEISKGKLDLETEIADSKSEFEQLDLDLRASIAEGNWAEARATRSLQKDIEDKRIGLQEKSMAFDFLAKVATDSDLLANTLKSPMGKELLLDLGLNNLVGLENQTNDDLNQFFADGTPGQAATPGETIQTAGLSREEALPIADKEVTRRTTGGSTLFSTQDKGAPGFPEGSQRSMEVERVAAGLQKQTATSEFVPGKSARLRDPGKFIFPSMQAFTRLSGSGRQALFKEAALLGITQSEVMKRISDAAPGAERPKPIRGLVRRG